MVTYKYNKHGSSLNIPALSGP